MAAPTNAALVKKVLANSEPSTHGPSEARCLGPRRTEVCEERAGSRRVQLAKKQ